jgi:hypothetical protein
MARKNLRFTAPALLVGTLALLAWCAGTAAAADAPEVQQFRFHLVGDSKLKVRSMTAQLTADTKVTYTLHRKGAEVAATLDDLDLTTTKDGREVIHMVMNKARMLLKQKGELVKDISRDNASAEERQRMDGMFGKPTITYTTDKDGRELKRSLSTAPGAEEARDYGAANSLRLFHPPFYAGKDNWRAPCEVSMGNKALVRGELTYEKLRPADPTKLVKVKVSGTLSNKEAKQGPVTAKDVVYKVKGEQTYDVERKQWVSGKLVMDVSFSLEAGGRQLGTATGEMTATLTALPTK